MELFNTHFGSLHFFKYDSGEAEMFIGDGMVKYVKFLVSTELDYHIAEESTVNVVIQIADSHFQLRRIPYIVMIYTESEKINCVIYGNTVLTENQTALQ